MSRKTSTLRRIARVRAVETRLGRLRLAIAMQDQQHLAAMAARVADLRSAGAEAVPPTGLMLRVHGEMASRLDDAAFALIDPARAAATKVSHAEAHHLTLKRREDGVGRRLAEAQRKDDHASDLRVQSLFRCKAGGVL